MRKRLVPVVRAGGAAGGAADGGGSGEAEAECVPALSHLPAAERRLAAQLLPPGIEELPLEADGAAAAGGAAAVGAAAAAGEGAAAGGVSLRNGAGKNVAKLRSWSEALGCGIALCRMEALQGDAPLERDDDGSGLMLPHRPSWWPERVK